MMNSICYQQNNKLHIKISSSRNNFNFMIIQPNKSTHIRQNCYQKSDVFTHTNSQV